MFNLIVYAIFIAVGAGGVILIALIYFNLDSILNLIDCSGKRNRLYLEPKDENPVYLKSSSKKNWPGWDGWYALFIPERNNRGKEFPFNIIRISLMTGLYGIEGIDNYRRLGALHNEAGESVGMVQSKQKSYLSQKYINKDYDIILTKGLLDIRLKDQSQIIGKWPNYLVCYKNDDIQLEVKLRYLSRNTSWWVNVKWIFSYWAAFSSIEGEILFEKKRYDLNGFGSFEHGWMKYYFNFNRIVRIARFFTKILHIRLIYYHYEILSVNGQFGAGTMLAGGPLGMNIRKRCETYFPDNKNIMYNNTKIKYLKFTKQLNPESNKEFNVPSRWEVSASDDRGEFKYTAEAKSPPAFIASNMIYYDFECEGYYKPKQETKKVFRAVGYGEYVFM